MKNRVRDRVPEAIMNKIEEIEAKVNSLSQEIGRYGICHGDFHANNFFVEENNIWLFDFDGCAYSNYLYDVASFIQSCLMFGYKTEKQDCRKVLYEDILPYFKIGYELNKECPDDYWDNLELMITYRIAVAYLALFEIEKCGVASNLDEIKQFFSYVISCEDTLAGMTQALSSVQGGKTK